MNCEYDAAEMNGFSLNWMNGFDKTHLAYHAHRVLTNVIDRCMCTCAYARCALFHSFAIILWRCCHRWHSASGKLLKQQTHIIPSESKTFDVFRIYLIEITFYTPKRSRVFENIRNADAKKEIFVRCKPFVFNFSLPHLSHSHSPWSFYAIFTIFPIEHRQTKCCCYSKQSINCFN